MERLNIKPLSVNEAYRGRRYSTSEHTTFKRLVGYSLKPLDIPKGKLEVYFEFGFSSAGSDVDNAVKSILDCLQKKYGFNDNRVYKIISEKVIVPKNKEYIKFKIKSYGKD